MKGADAFWRLRNENYMLGPTETREPEFHLECGRVPIRQAHPRKEPMAPLKADRNVLPKKT
jgi:hypothetical protein